jgi:hypothetical protein
MADLTDIVVLADCVERNAKNPAFELPTREERGGLLVGDCAKVVVVAVGRTPAGERIWIKVRNRDTSPLKARMYQGEVLSSPIISALKKGDTLQFGPEHICDIHKTVS